MSNGAEFGEWYIGVRLRTVEADRVSGCVGLLAVKYEMWNDSSLSYDLHMRKRESKKGSKADFSALTRPSKILQGFWYFFALIRASPGITNFRASWFWQILSELLQLWKSFNLYRCGLSADFFLSLLNKNAATLALSAFQFPLLTASLFHNWIPGLQSYIKLSNISQKKFVKIA